MRHQSLQDGFQAMSNKYTSYRLWSLQFAGSPNTLWGHVEPSASQLELATNLDIEVSANDTFGSVAARILETVGAAIGCPPRGVSSRQRELAEELGIEIVDCRSQEAAFIRIKEAIERSNTKAVRNMELEPGDEVTNSSRNRFMSGGPPGDPTARRVVLRVRPDGQVFFTDGGQAPARYLTKSPPVEVSSVPEQSA